MPVVGTAFEEWPEELKKLYDYDPTEAERLLDEAGYPRGADGIRFKLTMGHWDGGDLDYAQLVAVTYYRDIGVEVEVEPVPGAEWAGYINAAEWDMFGGMTMAAKYGNPLGFLSQLGTGASANRCNCADPAYDAILEAAGNAATEEEFLLQVKELIEHIMEQVWRIGSSKFHSRRAPRPRGSKVSTAEWDGLGLTRQMPSSPASGLTRS